MRNGCVCLHATDRNGADEECGFALEKRSGENPSDVTAGQGTGDSSRFVVVCIRLTHILPTISSIYFSIRYSVGRLSYMRCVGKS